MASGKTAVRFEIICLIKYKIQNNGMSSFFTVFKYNSLGQELSIDIQDKLMKKGFAFDEEKYIFPLEELVRVEERKVLVK